MEKLNTFCENTLKIYKIITEKICDKDDLASAKVCVLDTDFTYKDVLAKITNLEIVLTELKEKSIIAYVVLAADFESNVYFSGQSQNNSIDNFFFKKQYNELIHNSNSTTLFPSQPSIPWEQVFSKTDNKYSSLLATEFPFNDVKNTTGIIYKKFQSLLCLIFWFESKLDVIMSKNEIFLNNMRETLLSNKDINKKIGSISADKLEAFIQFLKNYEKINETASNIAEIEKKGESLIDAISSKTTEISDLLTNVEASKEKTDDLLEKNKELSNKLSSKALSGTFEKAANAYNWGKRGKLLLIVLLSACLFYFAYDMLKSFDIDKMILLEKTPLVLLMYSTPRLFVFIISAWTLKFLISNYNNDSNVALDFKHRQAIADVTPHFKKELDTKEKQEELVVNAFNVFLSKPQYETAKKEKDNTVLMGQISTLLNDSEIKNTLIKFKELVINKCKVNSTESKDKKP